MIYDWEQHPEPDPAECDGEWREIIPLPGTHSTDTILRCTGCGEWMFINGFKHVGTVPSPT